MVDRLEELNGFDPDFDFSDEYYEAEEDERERWMFDAIEASFKNIEPFRNLNRALIQEYTGHNYGANAGIINKRKKYLNKLFQAINGHMMLLAANRPQVMIQTEYLELRPFAKHYQVHVNNLLKEIAVEDTIRYWVLSAMFCLGVIKVHLKDSGMARNEYDITADPGIPFASNVYLDDWVHDMGVRKFSEIKFAGDMYRIPYSVFRQEVEDGFFDAEAARDLRPTTKFLDGDDPERVQNISKGTATDTDEFEPMIDLADIWLPSEGVIKTYAVSNRRTFRLKGKPLAVMQWDGIEQGPYHLLGVADVPENIMPASPASYWEAMDEFVNISMRKYVRHTVNMKENLCSTAAGTKTARSLRNSNDLEVLTDMDLNQVKLFRQGGADPNLAVAVQQACDQFDEQANNLKSILGLGAQAETLGQEELIRNAGNRIAAQMQYRVIDGTTKLVSNLGCLLWKDQFREAAGNIEVMGVRGEVMPIPSPWKADDREGDFQQYNFRVIPISMMDRSPTQQSQLVTQLLTQIYLPGLQIMIQQGISIDFAALTEMFADLLYLPELRRVISVQGVPNMDQQKPQTDIVGKSPVTSRNYTRTSKSAGPPGGRQLVHQQPYSNGSSNWSGGNGWVNQQ